MGRAAWIGCAVALGIVLASPAARAQGKDDPRAKKAARKLLRDGDRNLARGDELASRGKEELAMESYEAALRDYEAAFDAYPRPQIYFPIAQAEEKLGRPMRAFRHYQQLLEDADSISADLKKAVRARIAVVKKQISSIVFKIEPEGATISVDGEEIGIAPLAEPHWLVPGEHAYTVALRGYETVQGTVTVRAGKSKTETVTLEKVEGPVVTVKKDPTPPPPPKHKRAGKRPTALYVGVAVTGTLAAASAVFGGLAVYKHGRFSDESLSASAREKARTSGRRYAQVTDGLFIATLAAAAGTAYYYYGVYRPRRGAEAEAEPRRGLQPVETATWATPYTDGDGIGVAVGGTF